MGPNSGGYGGGSPYSGYGSGYNMGGSGLPQFSPMGGGQQYGQGMGVMGNSAASFDQSQNPWAQSNQTAFNKAYGGSPGGVSNQTPLAGGGQSMQRQYSPFQSGGSGLPDGGVMGPRGYTGPTNSDMTGNTPTMGQGSASPSQANGPQPWNPWVPPQGGGRPWPPQYQPPVPGGPTGGPQGPGPQPYNPPIFGGMNGAPPVNPYGGGMGSHQFGGWYGQR